MNRPAIFFFYAVAASASLAHAEDQTIKELDTLFVTAHSARDNTQTTRAVSVLEGDNLKIKAGATLGETLKQEPGITSQSFGPGVGTPVIRGQAGPRVKIMQNGLGNNDASNFSPDHANGVEPILAERIEVLRGPSTLLYGSGAIGGMVNVIDNRIPEKQPGRAFLGGAEQRYDSALDQTSSTVKLEGGNGKFAYHLDGFFRDGGDMAIGGKAIDETAARFSDPTLAALPRLQNSVGFVDNTQARARGGSVGFSRTLDQGFAGFAINHLDNTYGIPPDGTGESPVSINMQQTRYELKGGIRQPFAPFESVKVGLNHTDYRHIEMEAGAPGTTWSNQSYESRLELVHQPLGPVKGTLGFQSVNSDFAASGEEAVIPASKIDTYSVFAVEAMNIGAVTYELGARVEHQSIATQGEANRGDLPVSGSISAQWHFAANQKLNLAFTQSQRAPQVQELYTHGVHQATRSFELGNPDLTQETSYNLDLGYRFRREWMQAEFDLFHNWVSDYIHLEHTGASYSESEESGYGAGLPILANRQADAVFKGFEGKLVFPLLESHRGMVDLTLFSDYTRGQFIDGSDVPRMPPLRYGFQIDYGLEQWSANVRLTRGESQDHPGTRETNTPAWLRLDLGTQYQVKSFHDADLLVFAKASNLLDENIRNATSFLRNFSPEPGRAAQVGLRVSYD